MITSAITIQTHAGTPNTFFFKSASKLPEDGLLGDDGEDGTTPGELGLEGVPGTAPGALGDWIPREEGKLVGGRLYGWRL